MKKFKIPQLYLNGYVKNFDSKISKYALATRDVAKGSFITEHGKINNTTHYIHSGIMHLSLTHSSGKRKSLLFFGPGTIFPLGVVPHENLIDYEMELTCFTDCRLSSFPYPLLRKMCVEDGEMAAQILEQNCDFIGYLFYLDMNNSYSSSLTRVCDILMFYLMTIQPQNNTIRIGQQELADLVGLSLAQLERVLKNLRSENIILTNRHTVHVNDVELLKAFCSDELQEGVFDLT